MSRSVRPTMPGTCPRSRTSRAERPWTPSRPRRSATFRSIPIRGMWIQSSPRRLSSRWRAMRAEKGTRVRRASIARWALLGGAILLSGAGFAPTALADSVALVWTAPGDDWNTGRASSYEVRYSENPVAGDTVSWWASATSVGTIPAPLQAGSRESFIVAGLAPGTTFYFAIRTSDEVPNVSGFSNLAVKQTTGGSVPLATPG